MKKKNIITFKLNPKRPPKFSSKEWARLDAMTEEEINAAALSDPDCPPLTEEQLSRAVRIVSVKGLRQRLHLTQKEFAERFRLPLGTVRDWEQSRVIPDVAARVLLTLIDRAPKLVEKTLQKSARPPSVFREEFL